MAEQMGVQAVICLGDLDLAWIESLREPAIPKVGVHGNHDPPDLLREVEVEDLHGRRTSLLGRTVAGFEGCVRYGKGGPLPLHAEAGLQARAAAAGRRHPDLPLPAARHQRRPRGPGPHRLRGAARVGRPPSAAPHPARPHAPDRRARRDPLRRRARALGLGRAGASARLIDLRARRGGRRRTPRARARAPRRRAGARSRRDGSWPPPPAPARTRSALRGAG